jgi:cytochrome c-type biogenesis protein
MNSVNVVWAFLGGIVSFISPCVLPLIPGYLSFVSGLSIEELSKPKGNLGRIFVSTVVFVLGFSIVFALLGASASSVGQLLLTYRNVVNKVAGVLIIIFGLSLMGVIKIPIFQGGVGWSRKPSGKLGILVLGMTFAFAWTPCLGPILASILTLASTTKTVSQGVGLLFAYSLGLGIPFILTGLALSRFMGAFSWIKKHYQIITFISGLLIVAMGVLLITNYLSYIGTILSRFPSPENWLKPPR